MIETTLSTVDLLVSKRELNLLESGPAIESVGSTLELAPLIYVNGRGNAGRRALTSARQVFKKDV